MNSTPDIITGVCIALAAFTAIMRFKYTSHTFRPFLLMLLAAFVYEIASNVIMLYSGSTVFVTNAFFLVQSLLLLWQLQKWKLFKGSQNRYAVFAWLYVVVWCVTTFITTPVTDVNISYFLFYAFTTIVMSTGMLQLLMRQKNNLIFNPVFIITCSFIFFFIYTLFIQLYLMLFESTVRSDVILWIVRCITNAAFAYAVLLIPKRSRLAL